MDTIKCCFYYKNRAAERVPHFCLPQNTYFWLQNSLRKLYVPFLSVIDKLAELNFSSWQNTVIFLFHFKDPCIEIKHTNHWNILLLPSLVEYNYIYIHSVEYNYSLAIWVTSGILVSVVCGLQLGWVLHPIFSEEGDYPPLMKETVAKNSISEGRFRSRLPAFTPKEVKLLKGIF